MIFFIPLSFFLGGPFGDDLDIFLGFWKANPSLEEEEAGAKTHQTLQLCTTSLIHPFVQDLRIMMIQARICP